MPDPLAYHWPQPDGLAHRWVTTATPRGCATAQADATAFAGVSRPPYPDPSGPYTLWTARLGRQEDIRPWARDQRVARIAIGRERPIDVEALQLSGASPSIDFRPPNFRPA